MNKFLIALTFLIFLSGTGYSSSPSVFESQEDVPCDMTIGLDQEYFLEHDEFLKPTKPKVKKNKLTGHFYVCFKGFDEDRTYRYDSNLSFTNVPANGYKGGYFSNQIQCLDSNSGTVKMILHNKKTQSVDSDFIVKPKAVKEGYCAIGFTYCTRKDNKKGTSCKYNDQNKMENIELSFEFREQ